MHAARLQAGAPCGAAKQALRLRAGHALPLPQTLMTAEDTTDTTDHGGRGERRWARIGRRPAQGSSPSRPLVRRVHFPLQGTRGSRPQSLLLPPGGTVRTHQRVDGSPIVFCDSLLYLNVQRLQDTVNVVDEVLQLLDRSVAWKKRPKKRGVGGRSLKKL